MIANAWDTDVSRADIDFDIDLQVITIQDNGIGMNEAYINNKYLPIGYQRRKDDTWHDRWQATIIHPNRYKVNNPKRKQVSV